jgi:hypothetical protein
MSNIPDWAGTPPKDVSDWLSRLSIRTRNALSGANISSLAMLGNLGLICVPAWFLVGKN